MVLFAALSFGTSGRTARDSRLQVTPDKLGALLLRYRGGLFEDQGSKVGLEEVDDGDRLKSKAFESLAHDLFTVVGALNQLATAARANGRRLQRIRSGVIEFAAFAANPPAAEPMKHKWKIQAEDDHRDQAHPIPMEQVNERLDLNGRTRNAVEENNASGTLLQFALNDLFDQLDWSKRTRSDVAVEVPAEPTAFLGFAGEESAYFNDRERAAFCE
jgi:hypothetical protein